MLITGYSRVFGGGGAGVDNDIHSSDDLTDTVHWNVNGGSISGPDGSGWFTYTSGGFTDHRYDTLDADNPYPYGDGDEITVTCRFMSGGGNPAASTRMTVALLGGTTEEGFVQFSLSDGTIGSSSNPGGWTIAVIDEGSGVFRARITVDAAPAGTNRAIIQFADAMSDTATVLLKEPMMNLGGLEDYVAGPS